MWDVLISSMGITVRSYINQTNGESSPVSIYRNHVDENCKGWGTYVPAAEEGCSRTYLEAAKLLEYYGVEALQPEELLEFLKTNQMEIKCIGCIDYVNTSIIPLLEKEIKESPFAS